MGVKWFRILLVVAGAGCAVGFGFGIELIRFVKSKEWWFLVDLDLGIVPFLFRRLYSFCTSRVHPFSWL